MNSQQEVYFSKTLNEWIFEVHSQLVNVYQCASFNITEGDYGYDAYKSILKSILSETNPSDIMMHIKGQFNYKKYIALAHTAWTNNYVKWKSIQPSASTNNPLKSINTNERNDRATTHADQLNACDCEMYIDIINMVFQSISEIALSIGMNKLSM